jgi:hypothetical protein
MKVLALMQNRTIDAMFAAKMKALVEAREGALLRLLVGFVFVNEGFDLRGMRPLIEVFRRAAKILAFRTVCRSMLTVIFCFTSKIRCFAKLACPHGPSVVEEVASLLPACRRLQRCSLDWGTLLRGPGAPASYRLATSVSSWEQLGVIRSVH